MMNAINKSNPNASAIPQRPAIRMVEAFPVKTEEGTAYCIRDPQKIAANPLVLPPPAFLLASLMDGTRTLFEIQTAFSQQTGQAVPLNMLEEMIQRLDQELYLDSPHFKTTYQAIIDEFRNVPVRMAAHAGGAYEAKKEGLTSSLNQLFENLNGNSVADLNKEKDLSLLVSPHIDLHRGGPGFAHAYREVREREPSDLYVILGTGHQSLHSYITCTTKPFQTPLGITQTDTNFIDEFRSRVSLDVFEEEFIHRDEHSIEFQVLFLQHVLGEAWQGKIVPILCGSLHKFVDEGTSPRDDQSLADALDVLRNMIQEYDGKVTVIAGVDMSHVGKRFGHAEGAPQSVLQRVKQEDHQVLEALKSGKAEAFYRSVADMNDKNNVCGLTPVYTALDIVQPVEGSLLYYDQAVEGENDSVVTFASAAFYR